jgi:hypothetical protein
MNNNSWVFPSEAFPCFPEIHVDTPVTWTPAEAPGAVIALRKQVETGLFATNILATITRHSSDFAVEDAMNAISDELKQYQDAEIGDVAEAEVGGHPFATVDVAFRSDQAGTLLQVHMLTGVAAGRHLDIVHLVGTCAGGEAETDYRVLQEILNTTRVSRRGAEEVAS